MIEFCNVGEKFRLYHRKETDLKGKIINWLQNNTSPRQEFSALKNISCAIGRGEVVGIVGENGSGKTTLLKLIAGILSPDEGEMRVKGRVSALLELGVAFHPELSGRENVYLYGAVLGLSKNILDSKLVDIINFAELDKFIDAPVKTYSAGMYVRLGFAIAINVNPDILLIDEVLAVGDEAFQRKCIKAIESFKARGKTIIFVSHNMSLVSQICNRVIVLREGKIISDSTASEGISLYLQTAGEKKGIAVLKNGPLEAIFNNGRVLLCWNKRIITKGTGGHISFIYQNSQYVSFGAEWEILACDERSLVARGRSATPPLTQTWYLGFSGNRLSWQVGLDNPQAAAISQIRFEFMVSDKYRQWLNSFDAGDFPEFTNAKDWQRVSLIHKRRRFLGVSAAAQECHGALPAVIWDLSENPSEPFLSVYNSDSFACARVLNAQIADSPAAQQPRVNLFSAGIYVFDTREELDAYLKKIIWRELSEIIKAIRQKTLCSLAELSEIIKAIRQKTLCSLAELSEIIKAIRQKTLSGERYVVKKERLRFVFADKKVRILWDDCEITSAWGMYSAFLYRDTWFESKTADWQIEEAGSAGVLVRLSWRGLPVAQSWRINLPGDNSIKWHTYIHAGADVKITQSQMNIFISTQYRQWIYAQHKGAFPDIAASDNYWQEVAPKNNASWFAAVKAAIKEDKTFPAVIFDVSASENKSMVVIENSDYHTNARIIRSLTAGINGGLLTAGEPLSSAAIAIGAKSSLIDSSVRRYVRGISIGKKPLRLVFEQGKVSLFYKDKELTKRFGLYVSIRSSGIWHDSTRARWTLKKIGAVKMRACLEWLQLPINQIWEIEILDSGRILWRIEMDIYGRVQVEREQANVMLSDNYHSWFARSGRGGAFPEEFNDDYGGDWQSLWKTAAAAGFIAVSCAGKKGTSNGILPAVLFDCPLRKSGHTVNIVNSDRLFEARVLQCLKVRSGRNTELNPGRQSYFTGQIKVGNHFTRKKR
jgi:ABC-type polysaccharide/polyol phosphate transport system ATPase subunit